MPPQDPQDPPPPNTDNLFDLDTQRGRYAANKAARAARKAKREAEQKEQREARRKTKEKIRCKATAKNGHRCRASALPDNPEGLCGYHIKTESERAILLQQAQIVRAQAKTKPHELMRQVIESNPVAFMQPYLDALGIRIVFVPDPTDPRIMHPTAVVDPNSLGTVLFGVSKDGQVVISRHKDIEAQQRAAERLFDRVYGKPKQTNIIAGAATNEDPQLIPFDDKRQAEVAAILSAAKRPSHDNQTPSPTTPPAPGSQN